MYHEGEAIQNGLLQESFVIRRYLEVSSINPAFYQQPEAKYYLATIEKFHHSLKELSDYLYPAHIDNSLPLAIWHLLNKWKARLPGLNLKIELPTVWHQELPSTSCFLLMILEEFMQIAAGNLSSRLSIYIRLKDSENCAELTVQITDTKIPQQTYISNFTELDYIRLIFKFFMIGKCFYHCNNNTEIWCFIWRR
ncbi:MAG TPA: hypothetical protein DEF48_23970 [Nostoc sp. UBA8866]|nr:hypothetical protein [Nostoc sp. UBA8866]